MTAHAMDDESTLLAVKQYFAKPAEKLIVAYVFGSVARHTSRPTSDVDIAILYATPPSPSVSGPTAKMQAELEELLGRPVQLVVLNEAPIDLVHRVLRDGEIVYESDRRARIGFEVAARRQQLDLLPILRRYRRSV